MTDLTRRRWILALPILGTGVGLGAGPLLAAGEEEEGVAPAEDLMREHGVLKRVLLVYDEVRSRIAAKQDYPPAAVSKAAEIIRSFIEEYHERLEEDHLFPRFRKQGKLVELVGTLQAQHQAGRRLTDRIASLAKAGLKSDGDKQELSTSLGQFVRMYAPHEAREDTVLFPALHEIMSKREYEALGEEFEKKEHQLFGEDGFEKMVDRVAGIEKAFGIYDLSQFTPKL